MLFKKLGIISFFYLILTGSSSSTTTVNDSEGFRNLKTIVSQAGTILLKYADTKDIGNLGASCKALMPVTDEILTKSHFTIKTELINNDMFVKWIKARTPFPTLRFISLPQVLSAQNPMLAILETCGRIDPEIQELSNTTLNALSLEGVKKQDVNIVIAQMTSLKALTDLHLRVQVQMPQSYIIKDILHPAKIDPLPISQLTTLKKLSLSNIEIENNTQIFSALTALQDLALDFCRITNIEFIKKLVNLTSVGLKSYSNDDPPLLLDFLKPLLSLPGLTKLDVSNRFLSEKAAQAFPQSVTILHKGLK